MNPHVETSHIAERLEAVKKKFNLSNRQLSAHAKVSSTTIGDIISGKIVNPRYETFWNIATSLGISTTWLATGEGKIDDIDVLSSNSSDGGVFGQEVLNKVIEEIKSQYEARIAELKQYNQLLLDQLNFNKEIVQDFKEGRVGKSEGASIGRLVEPYSFTPIFLKGFNGVGGTLFT